MPKKSENVLLVIITPGDREQNRIALVSSSKLPSYRTLDEMNFKIINEDELPDDTSDAIVSLYHRLGLENVLPENQQDLKEYLDPKPPFTVDKVITFGWAV